MVERDIKKILTDIDIPEPDESVKEATIAAAMTEFSKQKAVVEKKIKGNEKTDRPISTLLKKLTYLGECTMKRRYSWPSAITACLIVVVFGVSQLVEESQHVAQFDRPGEVKVMQEIASVEDDVEFSCWIISGEYSDRDLEWTKPLWDCY